MLLFVFAAYSSRGEELLPWLTHTTYPTEMEFCDPKFAEKVYPDVVQCLLDSGVRLLLLRDQPVLRWSLAFYYSVNLFADYDMLLLWNDSS